MRVLSVGESAHWTLYTWPKNQQTWNTEVSFLPKSRDKEEIEHLFCSSTKQKTGLSRRTVLLRVGRSSLDGTEFIRSSGRFKRDTDLKVYLRISEWTLGLKVEHHVVHDH